VNGSGRRKRFFRYGIVGLLANVMGYGMFLLLLFMGTSPVLATGITFVVMVSVGYVANRRWTFRSREAHARDLTRYLAAYSAGLMVAMGAMYVLAGFMPPALAQVGVIGLSAIVIFFSLEFLRFGQEQS